MPTAHRLRRALALGVAVPLVVAGCSSNAGDTANPPGSTATSPTSPGPSSAAQSPSAGSSAPGAPGAPGSRSGGGQSGPAVPASSCVQRTYDRLTPGQRVGQLLMIGIDGNSAPTAVDGYVAGNHVGNVIYLGGWTGMPKVAATSNHLQRQATSAATGGVPLLIAADQEGGAVQQLKGQGFTRLLSAREQGTMPSAQRESYAATFGAQLRSAGINVDLAPVADTVPASVGTANAPIGRYGREYGNDPAVVAAAVTDVVQGLGKAKVAATVKHFPGIGRITGNTDVTSSGISDNVMTANDPYLQAFSAGIKAGAGLVMMSSARYPKLDAANQAPFSPAIIDGLLRGRLGWQGVVVTDDMNAVSVAAKPPGERAVRFVAAGGDLVLTGRPADAGPMIAALTERGASDKAFAQRLQHAQKRVLALKERKGLLTC